MQFRTRLLLAALPAVMLAAGASSPAAAAAGAPRVELDTTMGKIVVQLSPDRAPITVKNFLTYVKEGHYNGTIFHRVISGFMIQGGGYTPAMQEKPTHEPIPLEARGGLRNDRYTIAMARTNQPHSATCQWFVNTVDNDFLNADQAQDGQGYAVFGQVVSGMNVVDKIAAVKTGAKAGMSDVPLEPVVIKSAKILK